MTEQKDTHDLTKLTVVKLREIAKEYPDIQGTHAMKKEELIVAISKARGEPIPLMKGGKKKKKGEGRDIKKIKQEIQSLKIEKAKAMESKDHALLKKVRQRIKKLKRETRRVGSG